MKRGKANAAPIANSAQWVLLNTAIPATNKRHFCAAAVPAFDVRFTLDDGANIYDSAGVRSFALNSGILARPKRFELLTTRFVVE